MLGLDEAVVLLDKEIADSCCDACQQERAIATFGYWQAIDGGRHRTKAADEHMCGPVRAAIRNVALAVWATTCHAAAIYDTQFVMDQIDEYLPEGRKEADVPA